MKACLDIANAAHWPIIMDAKYGLDDAIDGPLYRGDGRGA